MKGIFKKINVYWELFKQFGIKYAVFRVKYELSKKIGLYNRKFSTHLEIKQYLTVEDWRRTQSDTFIFNSKEEINKEGLLPSLTLKESVEKILQGKINFFFKDWRDIGFENESFIHPLSKYEYAKVHWTQIPIYDEAKGDIKYVWEKSKFSYLLYLIRNDTHNNEDHAEFVFKEIIRWIEDNVPNIGPQYVCSQEIGIRLINWSFALFFYKNSSVLTQEIFNKIMSSIAIQLDHIYKNISFSKIAVRNNHAVTETLSLYLISLYFPFLTHSKKYKKAGKKWFEKEIEFQMFEDGSDSQYSFNYHRVKIQLLTLAISSAVVNDETFSPEVSERAKGSLRFLYNKIGNLETGQVSNFGYNDGSIYFKLNDAEFDNFLPQLNALASLLHFDIPHVNNDFRIVEDEFWFMQKINKDIIEPKILETDKGIINYEKGGFIQINEKDTLTLFKTPEVSFRVAQDDFFHLDIWVKGVNVLRDAGSYSYNTDDKTKMFFNGIIGHNSVSMNGVEHMMKGPRFTWLYKPKHQLTIVKEFETYDEIISKMTIFYPVKYEIERTVKKYKNQFKWEIIDQLINSPAGNKIIQFWHINPIIRDSIKILATDHELVGLEPSYFEGFYSKNYGVKEETSSQQLSSTTNYIRTTIEFIQ